MNFTISKLGTETNYTFSHTRTEGTRNVLRQYIPELLQQFPA